MPAQPRSVLKYTIEIPRVKGTHPKIRMRPLKTLYREAVRFLGTTKVTQTSTRATATQEIPKPVNPQIYAETVGIGASTVTRVRGKL